MRKRIVAAALCAALLLVLSLGRPYTASGDSDHAPPRGSAYPRFLEFPI